MLTCISDNDLEIFVKLATKNLVENLEKRVLKELKISLCIYFRKIFLIKMVLLFLCKKTENHKYIHKSACINKDNTNFYFEHS